MTKIEESACAAPAPSITALPAGMSAGALLELANVAPSASLLEPAQRALQQRICAVFKSPTVRAIRYRRAMLFGAAGRPAESGLASNFWALKCFGPGESVCELVNRDGQDFGASLGPGCAGGAPRLGAGGQERSVQLHM